jgi:hypothetical protein
MVIWYGLSVSKKSGMIFPDEHSGNIIPLGLSIAIPKSEIRNQFSPTNFPFLNSPLTSLPSG